MNYSLAQIGSDSRLAIDTFYFQNQTKFTLKSKYAVDSILSLTLNAINLRENDYSRLQNKIILSPNLRLEENNQLIVTYKILPIIINETYRKNVLTLRYDSSRTEVVQQVEKTSPVILRDIFGKDIQKSGTLIRGFQLGSNKDLTLSSGLRLQLSGKLSEELDVVAVLTDENSPIQPEGNTQSLQELDKVYIELKHKYFKTIFGDYQIENKIGEFGLVQRKLQGLKTNFSISDLSDFELSYASSKGKFNSMQFNGIDGVQGPYRLTGVNGERDIIVLAGTEKVFINGEPLTRGENYDYTIEYSNGELYFTPKKIITNASRIAIDFEYSDRKYSRNFFGASAQSKFIGDLINLGVSYYREGDDQDSPIEFSLEKDDREILKNSGSDQLKASRSGVKFVGLDSLGKPLGVYSEIDTVINGENFKYYLYSPGSPSALYNVSFSFVGVNKGDYDRVTLGNYKFVGRNKGSYLPILLLPLPELNQIGNIFLKSKPLNWLMTEIELSFSSRDKNRLSSIDDDKNFGNAYRFKLGLDSVQIKVNQTNFGSLSMNYYEKFQKENYSPINRLFEVEYNRNWNLPALESGDQITREVSLLYSKMNELNISTSYGYLKRGESFRTKRYSAQLNSYLFDALKINYSLTNLSTSNISFLSSWFRNNGSIVYDSKLIMPEIRFEFENKKEQQSNLDSLMGTSFKFVEIGSKILLKGIDYINLTGDYTFRKDFFPIEGKIVEESNSNIYQIDLSTKQIQKVNSTLSFAYRTKNYTQQFEKLNRLDNNSLAIKFLTKGEIFEGFTGFDIFYEVASQRSAKLEKVFLKVQRGLGSYIYKGDLNSNGIADEFEFEPAKYDGDYILITIPTTELFPVTDLKTSTRLKFSFSKLKFPSFLNAILNPISNESYFRIEENSKDENLKNIYFVRVNTFQRQLTTIRGVNFFQNDFYIYENDPSFNTRIRFMQRKSFNQYAVSNERRFQSEKSIRLRFRLTEDISNQTEYLNTKDELLSSNSFSRNYEISSSSVNTKFSYFPIKKIEVSFKIEVGRSYDYFPLVASQIDFNSLQLGLIFFVSDLSRLNLEFERSELVGNTSNNVLPFELLRGNSIGKNYYLRMNFDYRISSNLHASLNYEGRQQGSSKFIHNGRAEMRAYF